LNTASADEAGTIAAAQGGDATAFARLVRAHQGRVRHQLRRLTSGDTALADDLAQDVFLQAWRALPQFRGEAAFGTWLYRIAYSRFLTHRRSAPPAAISLDAAAAAGPEEGATPALDPLFAEAAQSLHVPSGSAAARPLAEQAAQRIDLERALQALSEPQRLALIHCFALDLAHGEAAAVLGWPLGTLKSHLARGKAALRERLLAWRPAGSGAGMGTRTSSSLQELDDGH
jgi:RNA polymerase sigma-70 factor, ECF subfamily